MTSCIVLKSLNITQNSFFNERKTRKKVKNTLKKTEQHSSHITKGLIFLSRNFIVFYDGFEGFFHNCMEYYCKSN